MRARRQTRPRRRHVQTSALRNAGKGKRVLFHGAYKSRDAAEHKRAQVGGTIEERTIRGHKRYVVITSQTRMTQQERYKRRPAMNKRRRRVARAPARGNPGELTPIYGRVKSVLAVKGPGHICDAACKRAHHTYVHKFRDKVGMYGRPDGSVLLRWDGD
jgi:hypothetical protein